MFRSSLRRVTTGARTLTDPYYCHHILVPRSVSVLLKRPVDGRLALPTTSQVAMPRRWQSSAGGTAKGGEDVENPFSAMPDGINYAPPEYDPWAVLGVKKGASLHDIRLQYHNLSQLYHPDMAKDPATADIIKWNEVDRAYQIITKSSTLDKRFRKHVSGVQLTYYKYLPEWMSRNVDEMPRWWTWMKWRTDGGWALWGVCSFCLYVWGCFAIWYPYVAFIVSLAIVTDVLFHTTLAPIAFTITILKWLMMRNAEDMSFMTSPKGFLRRSLTY